MNDTPIIKRQTVQTLVAAQFPGWAHLDIKPVDSMGWDNRTFHLGQDMLARLPAGPGYAAQPAKEWICLPHLSGHLPVPVPTVLGQGRPSSDYPYDWSILSYLPGKTATAANGHAIALAQDVANALTALRNAPVGPGPAPGQHNYHRGGDLRIYDQDIRHALNQTHGQVDRDQVLKLWTKACHSTWANAPVWVHGDMAQGNIITTDNHLSGIIDWGCCAVGDPACDLTIAWTLFQGEARTAFKQSANYDPATWARARGWAAWKAALQIAKGDQAANQTMNAILQEP